MGEAFQRGRGRKGIIAEEGVGGERQALSHYIGKVGTYADGVIRSALAAHAESRSIARPTPIRSATPCARRRSA